MCQTLIAVHKIVTKAAFNTQAAIVWQDTLYTIATKYFIIVYGQFNLTPNTTIGTSCDNLFINFIEVNFVAMRYFYQRTGWAKLHTFPAAIAFRICPYAITGYNV